jgi:hypothetical protein
MMMILTGLKWAAIAVITVVVLCLAVIALFALAVLAEHLLYRLSRWRTLKALDQVKALKAQFAEAVRVPGRNNPLMRGYSLPISRFDAGVDVLVKRCDSLEDDNIARRGAYTRSEWRHLRRDVKAVLRRGEQLACFLEAPAARDGIWPFTDDSSSVFADSNYAGRQPAGTGVFSAGAEAFAHTAPTPRRSAHRNWAVNSGALDEDVMPSAEERRQAQAAAFADKPAVTVLRPAARNTSEPVVYNRTGQVICLAERRGKINVKA